MVLKIVRRQGLGDPEPVALWEEGEGFTEVYAEPFRYAEDPVYEEMDEDLMYEEFDGPDLFAVPAEGTTKSTQKSLGEL